MGPGNRERRLPIVVASIVTAVVILAATATLATAFVVLSWNDELIFVSAGALAGIAIGSVRRGHVFDASLAIAGIGIGAWALTLAVDGVPVDSQVFQNAVPLLSTGVLSLFAALAISRSWGRAMRPNSTPLDIDELVSEPGGGGIDDR